MTEKSNMIKCPNCAQEINVSEAVYHQLDNELKKKYNEQLIEDRKKIKELEFKIQEEKKSIEDEITHRVKNEKIKIEKDIKRKIEEEQAEQIKALKEEIEEKSNQVKDLNKSKAEIERLKREKEELRDKIEFESQQQLNKMINEEREKIKRIEEDKSKLKVSEKENIINQLQEQLREAQRKAAQGSTQLQGEVHELAIEDWLINNFPLDSIQEIKKGEKGADCIQIVNTYNRQNCGSIYYESKRTKHFQVSWIEKFKSDIRDKNANIGVLVTDTMPQDMKRMGLKEGIWICSFDEFKSLCPVLRETLIQISNAIITQENKGDKMIMLYDFLTSNEFRLQVEAIVEGFTQMKNDLDSEKRAMTNIWKKREKQIEKVLINTTHMYGSIKGIAGSAVQDIASLELSFNLEEISE